MKRIQKLLLASLSLLPVTCHYKFTAPLLWAHSSSQAFNTWVGLWIIVIGFVVWSFAQAMKNDS